MKRMIIPYQLTILLIVVIGGLCIFYKIIDLRTPGVDIFLYCSLFGVLGGVVHCMRGYYLHTALLKNWDADWNAWYYIRPFLSGIMGFISLVFIKAGLLVFSSNSNISVEGNQVVAYLAVAFIAGYNVQNFLAKLEEVFSVLLGIEKKFPTK